MVRGYTSTSARPGTACPERTRQRAGQTPRINSPITQYSHGLGFSNPNATYNVGADITLTPKIVSTTRYGYFFNNYHDFGWPTTGVDLSLANRRCNGALDNSGNPCQPLCKLRGWNNDCSLRSNFTEVNASKHYQFNQDVAFFKSGWSGTHNIKAGYQFNQLSNVINQHGNLPSPTWSVGARTGRHASEHNLRWQQLRHSGAAEWGICAGQYGYM